MHLAAAGYWFFNGWTPHCQQLEQPLLSVILYEIHQPIHTQVFCVLFVACVHLGRKTCPDRVGRRRLSTGCRWEDTTNLWREVSFLPLCPRLICLQKSFILAALALLVLDSDPLVFFVMWYRTNREDSVGMGERNRVQVTVSRGLLLWTLPVGNPLDDTVPHKGVQIGPVRGYTMVYRCVNLRLWLLRVTPYVLSLLRKALGRACDCRRMDRCHNCSARACRTQLPKFVPQPHLLHFTPVLMLLPEFFACTSKTPLMPQLS